MRRPVSPLATPAAVALALCAAAVAAQPIQLERVVISGALTPVDAQSFARAVTIITAEDIERRQVRTVADLFRQVPGAAVSRLGGPGGESSLRIRGSESNHVLVLIDGVEAAGGAEAFDFSTIDPANIERVEVLRGPQSALYGAGATAGVVNIFTRGGVRGPVRGGAAAEVGTGPSGLLSGFVGGGGERYDLGLNASFRRDQGWDARQGGSGDDDGARNLTLGAQGAIDVRPDVTLRGVARYVDRMGEYDGSRTNPIGRVDGRDAQLGLWADWSTLGGALVNTPSVAWSIDENDTTDAFGPSRNDASTLRAGWQSALSFGPEDAHTVVGALQFRRESFENTFAGADRKERDQLGYVLDYRGQLTDRLFVQGGLRFDDNDEFEDFVSWSLSASYALFETGARLRASVGRAQTNPTFFEQFGFIPGEFTGNPALRPERNLGFDVGVDQDLLGGRARLSATAFHETLEDEISGFGTGVRNLDGESKRRGFELEGGIEPMSGLTLSAAYTFLLAEEPNGQSEVRRPRHSGGLQASYAFMDGRARVGADLTWIGQAEDTNFSAGRRVDVGEALVVDLSASYAVTEAVEVYGGVRNLLDEDYEEAFGYAAEPLTGFVGLRARF